jgi:hypothetical protein
VKVVVLVPRRADNGWRDQLWAFCRDRWEQEFPDWRIVEGEHRADEGLFNRSAAVNRAAAAAGDWDVAVIIDSDIVADRRGVETAVRVAANSRVLAVSHDERVMLSKRFTQAVLKGSVKQAWDSPQSYDRIWSGSWETCSCCTVVPRGLWDKVGGFDEQFVGWGNEDWAFRLACETFCDAPMVRVATKLYHLWHPVQDSAKSSAPTRSLNENRWFLYKQAQWNPVLLDHILAVTSGGEDDDEMIPQIIHRTVPQRRDRRVDGFWREFQRMHPRWDLRSWEEPLQPSDFPLTSALWDRCQNGAQKAGLVRLELLYTYGGIYVDSDVQPLRAMEPLLSCRAFAGWEDDTVVPDAVMGSVPGHPAFLQLLEAACAGVENGANAWQTGPGNTTATLVGRDDVMLLPPGAFYPYHYLEKSRARENFMQTAPWAFCVHHWHGSWLDEQQKRSIERRQR